MAQNMNNNTETELILRDIKFQHKNRKYCLMFNHFNIMQIRGDSATGKSLFLADFKYASRKMPELGNSLLINYFTQESLRLLAGSTVYNYVIIDNADIILTPDYDRLIQKKILAPTSTHWIIMGRESYHCVISSLCIGTLQAQKLNNGITEFSVLYKGV